tara:strand:- start:2765 stop:4402 length:1638 start_codon:yes stop_codon:yes gene_type:complete
MTEDNFPFGYENRQGRFIHDLESYREVYSKAKMKYDNLKENRKTEQELDKLIVQEVKGVANTNLSDKNIAFTVRKKYKEWQETNKRRAEGELPEIDRLRPNFQRVLEGPLTEFRAYINKLLRPKKIIYTKEEYDRLNRSNLISYGDRKVTPDDKTRFVRLLMLNSDKEIDPKYVEEVWGYVTNQEMNKLKDIFKNESLEEIAKISDKYKKEEDLESGPRKLFIRLNDVTTIKNARPSSKGRKRPINYRAVQIRGRGEASNLFLRIRDDEDEPLNKPIQIDNKVAEISLAKISQVDIKQRLDILGFEKFTEYGTPEEVNRDFVKYIRKRLEGTQDQYLQGVTIEDYYDSIYKDLSELKGAVTKNITSISGEETNRRLIKETNEDILNDISNVTRMKLDALGKIVAHRPQTENTVIRDAVINVLDQPAGGKTVGYFLLRAIISKIGYNKIALDKTMLKSIDNLSEKDKRKVKTYLQDADPTEYFGEEYLKLGKLINILDEVEGNTGELENLDEENLKLVKVLASLRKRYENLYEKIRERVYPEDEEE